MKYTIVLLLAIICSMGVEGVTEVNICEEEVLLPEVDIKDCTTPPCTLYQGSDAILNLNFRAPYYLENIAPKVVAIVGGASIPYPLDQKDACEGIINTSCPVAENEQIEYTFTFPISEIYPTIPLTLKFSLYDNDKEESFVCFKVDLQVKKP